MLQKRQQDNIILNLVNIQKTSHEYRLSLPLFSYTKAITGMRCACMYLLQNLKC